MGRGGNDGAPLEPLSGYGCCKSLPNPSSDTVTSNTEQINSSTKSMLGWCFTSNEQTNKQQQTQKEQDHFVIEGLRRKILLRRPVSGVPAFAQQRSSIVVCHGCQQQQLAIVSSA